MTGFSFWNSATKARAIGFTHRARVFGIVPGFLKDPYGECCWMNRSDLLNPIEDLLSFFWVNMRIARGDEPDFGFMILGEL